MLGQKSDVVEKNASSTKNSYTELNKSKRTLVKGPKPLQKLKFYLDIKNHAITTKLEGKIKELGGVVELFLDREVTHVISDRPACAENSTDSLTSPATPRLRSVECANDSLLSSCESPATGRLRQKTRADAMLEKVRSQSTTKVRDPLQNAKLWGIPIWTVNKVFSWLERVSITVVASEQKTKKVKVISISSPFVKFEPITRNARPIYKTIKTWPIIDLESNSGKSAFVNYSDDVTSPAQDHKSHKESKDKQKTAGSDKVHQPDSTNDSRMTRKQRTRLSVRGGKEREDKQTLIGGYCEICHCEYQEIGEHVRSEQHLNFVKNDANFLELDSLISAGANVEAFLRLNGTTGKDLTSNYPIFGRRSLRKLNGKSSPEKCNGGLDTGYSPPVTRNKMPRTRSSQHSQTNTSHHLRSRGHIWHSSIEEPQHLLLNNRDKSDELKVKEISSDGPKLKKCLKTKRISADERLVADNKSYYKVEVMTTKLRSSGLGTKEIEVVRRPQTPIPEEADPEDQGLVVKFRRVRRSELSVLNDEAENFMFPRKDDPSFSDIETDDGPNTTQSPMKSNSSSDIRSSEPHLDDHDESLSMNNYEMRRKRKRNETSSQEDTIDTVSVDNFVNEIGLRRKTRKIYTEIEEHFDETSKDDCLVDLCEIDTGRKRKRRNLCDCSAVENQSHQETETSTPIVSKTETTNNKNNGDLSKNVKVQTENELETEAENVKVQLSKDDLKFSFEQLPVSEPWYGTFRRQDNGEEYYTCTSDPADYRGRFILPYQLPYIVPLDPKVCIDEYLRKKQILLQGESSESTSDGAAVGENSNSTDTMMTFTDMDNSLQGCSESTSDAQKGSEIKKQGPGRKKRKKSRFLKLSANPRKSPRQHASTLAILSSLIQQRKKRERKSHGESDISKVSLGTIPEEHPAEDQQSVEFNRVIEDILSAPMDDISEPEILDLTEAPTIEIKHRPDAIELIQNFDKVESPIRGLKRKSPRSIGDTSRVVRRKRKKNRTGWPKKKRLLVKRIGRKSEASSSLPELEDSRLTGLSGDTTGEVEMCDLVAESFVPSNEETNRTNVNRVQQATICGDKRCELVNKDNENLNDRLREAESTTLEHNTLQGVLQCTERINNSVNVEINIQLNTNNVLVENINNNSEIKLKEECEKDEAVVNTAKSGEISPKIPYNVTILDCKKPQLKRKHRNSSSDCSGPEEVIASHTDRLGSRVNVALDKWENAEKVLHAKVQDNESGKLIQFQPFVRVKKIENSTALLNSNRRLRSSSSPERKPKAKKTRIVPPTSPRSPRKLRTPRGKWYRER